MYFDIDLAAQPPTVRLEDLENFRIFQIEASGPRERMADAIAPYGRWDGEFAWFVSWRRGQAVRPGQVGPRGKFDERLRADQPRFRSAG